MLLITARYAQWTSVMLEEVRRSEAPTYAASVWLREHVATEERVWIHGSLEPFAEYFLTDRDVQLTTDESEVRSRGRADEYYAFEGGMLVHGNQTFVRPRGRLWDVTRQRYFAVAVVPISNLWQFVSGWYDEEQFEKETWRWMSARGEVVIPPAAGQARLRLTLAAQDRIEPDVEVEVNGVLVDRFHLQARKTTREWVVSSRGDAPNRLVLRASTTMNPKALGLSEDSRDLSLRLFSYGWQPLR
jgi:hypothetical protein